jgi:hypothetical protein
MKKHLGEGTYLCSEIAPVHYRDRRGRQQTLTGNIERISPTHLSILVDSAIAPGTSVSIECQQHTLRGRVGRTDHHPILGCFLEIELDPHCRWSRQLFAPKHLLALALPPALPRIRLRYSPYKTPKVTEEDLRANLTFR